MEQGKKSLGVTFEKRLQRKRMKKGIRQKRGVASRFKRK